MIKGLTVEQAAEELGYSVKYIYELKARGKLKVKNGFITLESIIDYKVNRKKPGRPKGTFKENE